ncbi:hypothetical protein Q5P01_011644 [Channa striata]|uniref:Uncharacterized protein n=1 Tax=Channa striata TaxID=64152 RepID=A0AA88MXB7_CHASR|nr:hypothetical protein Q5P01_011644 [Channa striata]
MFPALREILETGCCRAVGGAARRLIQASITTAIGTVQIMVGLFNIGLGPGRTSTSPGDLTSLGAAYWLGSVFIVTGILSIVAGQFPSSCLLGFTVFMNIVGAIFAITGIVLYFVDLSNASLLRLCDQSSNNVSVYGDSCRHVALFAQKLIRTTDITLIALALLQLHVSIRFAVLGIRALMKEKDGAEEAEEPLPQFEDK